MNIVNLTPHSIKILDDDEKVLKEIPSSGQARARQEDKKVWEIENIPIFKTKYKELYYKDEKGEKPIPKKQKDTIYIVSTIACQASQNREDFYIINKLIRDDDGNIIGAKGLSQNPYL